MGSSIDRTGGRPAPTSSGQRKTPSSPQPDTRPSQELSSSATASSSVLSESPGSSRAKRYLAINQAISELHLGVATEGDSLGAQSVLEHAFRLEFGYPSERGVSPNDMESLAKSIANRTGRQSLELGGPPEILHKLDADRVLTLTAD